jgi:PilZ domain
MEFAGVSAAQAVGRSERRGALMMGIQPNQRNASRFFVTAATKIRTQAGCEEHVGLVRDLSGNGIFVYSDFTPECGSRLEVILRTSKMRPRHVSIACRGKVVRVEPSTSGAAIGIAVAVDEYEFRIQNGRPQLNAGAPSDQS